MTQPHADEMGPLGLTQREVEAAFQPDVDDAVSNVVATPFKNGRGWEVSGDTTMGTDLVAAFRRSLRHDANGEIVARHVRLDVDPYFQGQGYAKALLRSSFALYRRLGVHYVELDAVGDGTLVWARFGWSLHGPSIADVHAEIGYTYAERHRCRPPDDFHIPLFGPDLLALHDHLGYPVGEETLRRLAISNREIAMRLYLGSERPVAALQRRGIV